jgi:hypothetical protein
MTPPLPREPQNIAPVRHAASSWHRRPLALSAHALTPASPVRFCSFYQAGVAARTHSYTPSTHKPCKCWVSDTGSPLNATRSCVVHSGIGGDGMSRAGLRNNVRCTAQRSDPNARPRWERRASVQQRSYYGLDRAPVTVPAHLLPVRHLALVVVRGDGGRSLIQ